MLMVCTVQNSSTCSSLRGTTVAFPFTAAVEAAKMLAASGLVWGWSAAAAAALGLGEA
jgi:hypothetical protein